MASKVRYEEEYIVSGEGLNLFTCQWLPKDREQKGLVFLCHGYAMECSISYKDCATRLVKAGYGVYGIDYIGHGKSAGLHGFIPDFDQLVQDCADHFTKVCERRENKGKKKFLMGESMGGAVLLLLHRKKPSYWDGAVLVAPMCKIAEDIKPSPTMVRFLTKLAYVIPTWKIVPSQDIIDAAVKDPERKKEVRSNPYWYTGRPRLKTAQNLLEVSLDLEVRLNEITLPFIVCHGGDDKVTDPAVSKMLYDSAMSTDKTFKLYTGMWHALTYGELPENIDKVFNDIIDWLDERSSRNLSSSDVERERKLKQDKNANIEKANN